MSTLDIACDVARWLFEFVVMAVLLHSLFKRQWQMAALMTLLNAVLLAHSALFRYESQRRKDHAALMVALTNQSPLTPKLSVPLK